MRGEILRARVPLSPGGRGRAGLLLVPGLLLAGYGGLVLMDVIAHESPVVGAALLLAGSALAWAGRPRTAPGQPEAPPMKAPTKGRAALIAVFGAFAAGGVLAYNMVRGSTLSLPELGILAYGIALLAAAAGLDRRIGPARVDTLVAWSFPLAAAPFGLYALDAALDAGFGSSPADAFIRYGLVTPTMWGLNLFGFSAEQIGQTIALETPRNTLFLSVGLVCAGFQPGILFLGVFGLHAWQERTPPRRLVGLLALGLAGVYFANLLRILILTLVGWRWGGATLQLVHQHAGWFLFVGWMIVYWWLVLRRFEGDGADDAPS